MSTRTRSPAGRAPLPLVMLSTLAVLPKPAQAFWYSRSCVPDTSGTLHCTGLSYSAGAGLGLCILLLILLLIFLAAYLNRPLHPLGDVEEVWVAPAGVFAVSPMVGQVQVLPMPGQGYAGQLAQVQAQERAAGAAGGVVGAGGVYPWMPSTYRSPYPQPQQQQQPQGTTLNSGTGGERGAPLAPPPPSPMHPYPSPIPEQTPRSSVMRDVPLNSAPRGGSYAYPYGPDGEKEEERRLYESGGAQDVWRQPGTGRIVVRDPPAQEREREKERRAGLR